MKCILTVYKYLLKRSFVVFPWDIPKRYLHLSLKHSLGQCKRIHCLLYVCVFFFCSGVCGFVTVQGADLVVDYGCVCLRVEVNHSIHAVALPQGTIWAITQQMLKWICDEIDRRCLSQSLKEPCWHSQKALFLSSFAPAVIVQTHTWHVVQMCMLTDQTSLCSGDSKETFSLCCPCLSFQTQRRIEWGVWSRRGTVIWVLKLNMPQRINSYPSHHR